MSTLLSAPPELDTSALDGWQVHEFAEVPSTSLLAAHLPPWSAVRADVQSAGRGRMDRPWVSDAGGLWLSAVVPTPGPADDWALLPLAAAWAVFTVVQELGAREARLRWPNDILLDRRKLAGVLVDRFSGDAAVVGIGINLDNHPDASAPALAGQTARLGDLPGTLPTPSELALLVLAALAREHHRLESGEAASLCGDLNRTWQRCPVQVTLAGGRGSLYGHFKGIDPRGRLLLRSAAGAELALPPHQVDLFREIS